MRLHDIDAGRLGIVHALCAHLAKHRGVPLKFTATTDLVEAVRGADAVLNSSRPGGFASRRLDETLPLEFGMPGQETVGPGGFLFALRSVPAALELYAIMQQHAPAAVLLNYTNPTNIVTQALRRQTRPHVLGLCDQSDEIRADLAVALDKRGPAEFRCVGLNHATWYSDLTLDGAPIELPDTPLLPPAGLDEEHRLRFGVSEKLARQYRGYWPNSYLPYYEFPARLSSSVAAQRAAQRCDCRRTRRVLPALRGSDEFPRATAGTPVARRVSAISRCARLRRSGE